MNRKLTGLSLLLASIATPAFGHFVFIVPQDQGAKAHAARVIMSENLEPDTNIDIHLLHNLKIALRAVAADDKPVAIEEGDAHAYKLQFAAASGTRVLHGDIFLGVRSKDAKAYSLTYFPKTIVGDPFGAGATIGAGAEIVPQGKPGELKLRVLFKGKPAGKTDVTIILPNKDQKTLTTDEDGVVGPIAESGRIGAWARCVDPKPGTLDGKAFAEARSYPTLVIDVPKTGSGTASAAPAENGVLSDNVSKWTPLPQAVASFGGVISNDWLYIYGGHTANTHEYTTASVSGQFHRIRVSDPKQWETLAGGHSMQGMNLAAYQGKIYRVGGMEPRNKPSDKAKVVSITDVAIYDPATAKWTETTPMPTPRSSHDVAVIGHTLYVVGGWSLTGKTSNADWPDSALSLDLSASEPKWKPFAQPFQRRALIAAVFEGKIYAIGGFDEGDNPNLRVDAYDPQTDKWLRVADLPGPNENGFGPAACVYNNRLYVSVGDGTLNVLDTTANRWTQVAKTTPRIVHRLAPVADGVLVIGGASHGKNFDLIEKVTLPATAPTGITAAHP